jgi:hypothetical protein
VERVKSGRAWFACSAVSVLLPSPAVGVLRNRMRGGGDLQGVGH